MSPKTISTWIPAPATRRAPDRPHRDDFGIARGVVNAVLIGTGLWCLAILAWHWLTP